MLKDFKKKFIGTRKFYGMLLRLAIPMILQNMITSFVSLLDNIMVGRVGTEQMSGVAIANQLIFVFQVSIFGAVSGPGIFGAQFYGKADYEGQRYTVRMRIILTLILSAAAIFIFGAGGERLISLYLSGEGGGGDLVATLGYGMDYLEVMLVGLIPFALSQAYASSLRECGHTLIPMLGSLSAVLINLILDYGLIFGKLGMPELGVRGAAVATIIAKLVECMVMIIWTHTHTDQNKFAVGLYRSLKLPGELLKRILVKSAPLMANEFLWAFGMASLNQCYARRGLEVVAAQNIANTMINLFNIVYLQLGACIAIVVGQQLGAGKLEKAREYCYKTIFFSIITCFAVILFMIPAAGLFPNIYRTQEHIKRLATYMILVQAAAMPLICFVHCCYFTLRSGGKTVVTFLFDSLFVWVVMLPVCNGLVGFTTLPIRPIFFIVTFTEIIKVIIGFFMVRSDVWLNNIVES